MPSPADSRAGRIAFTNPDFVLFQIARFMIVAAVEMQAVAVGWQVYVGQSEDEMRRQTPDPIAIGATWTLPAAGLGPGFDGRFYYLAQTYKAIVELTPVKAPQS